MATMKKKEEQKQPGFLDRVAPLPSITPNTPTQSTNPPSQYKPQRYNEKTGQVEDIKKTGTSMTRKEFQNTNFKTLGSVPQTTEQQLQAEIDKENLKAQLIANQPNPSDVLLSQIGQLTPEQQALANSNAQLPGNPNFVDVLRTAGERAAIGAAGGAVAGGTAGSVIPGLGTLAGAGVGAVGAGLVGGVTALFTEYKKTSEANYNTASYNYNSARTNMEDSITLANSGAGFKSNELAIKNFNEAEAQIRLAERQLKELRQTSTVRAKLVEIEDYKRNDQARLRLELYKSIQKPTVKYVNNGGVQ